MRIAILAGGLSPERDVSLSSGCLIANALIENGHSVCLLDLYLGVHDVRDATFFNALSGKRFHFEVPQYEPDLDRLVKESGNGGALIGKNVIEICKTADLAFLALHGDIGENGKLQAVFDVYGVKYTGTGYKGSLLAMDKDISKRLMVNSGILTPQWVLADIDSDGLADHIQEIGLPCAIKPCNCGSSVGVTMINNMNELDAALEYAKRYEKYILIEKKIEGREFSVGILDARALPPIEIIPTDGFYDYTNKYQPGAAKEVCPAEISEDISNRLKETALHVHKALRLGSYSRVDFMLDAYGGIYCLEANTLPGMTPTSLLPQEAAAVGISYNALCERIAELAV